jgi:hypothetical protein
VQRHLEQLGAALFGREALVAAVLDDVERLYLDLLDRTLRQQTSARAALEAMAEVFLASLETNLLHALVWLDWSTSFRAEYWHRFLRFMERVLKRVEDTIRRGQREGSIEAGRDPNASARLFVGAAQMAVQMKLTGAEGDRTPVAHNRRSDPRRPRSPRGGVVRPAAAAAIRHSQ